MKGHPEAMENQPGILEAPTKLWPLLEQWRLLLDQWWLSLKSSGAVSNSGSLRIHWDSPWLNRGSPRNSEGSSWSHGVPPGNCGGSSWSKLCSSWIYRFTSLGHRVSILSMGGPPRSSQSSPVEQWRFTMDNGDNSLALWRLVMEPWNASKVCRIHPEAYPESVEAHHGANLWRLTQKLWRLQFLYFEVIFEL
jgi:hypothetical protein